MVSMFVCLEAEGEQQAYTLDSTSLEFMVSISNRLRLKVHNYNSSAVFKPLATSYCSQCLHENIVKLVSGSIHSDEAI